MAGGFQISCSQTTECIAALKSMLGSSGEASNVLEIIKALGPTAAILTGVGGIFLNHYLNKKAAKSQSASNKKQLASAILGEISATRQHIIDSRYISFYRILQRNFESGVNTKIPQRNSSGQFFITYLSNSTENGSLPAPLPQKISEIYTKYVGLQEDLRTVIMPEWNNCDIQQKLPTIKSMIRRLNNVQKEAEALILDLHTYIDSN
jgi:hypothetical protein